jgi:hypothetical protein
MADRGWKRAFEDPIPLPRGHRLVTLQDAGTYITKLPKAEHEAPEWQTAIEMLLKHQNAAAVGCTSPASPSCRRCTGMWSGCSILIAKTIIGESASWRVIDDERQITA